jgi:hypothetical protein
MLATLCFQSINEMLRFDERGQVVVENVQKVSKTLRPQQKRFSKKVSASPLALSS